MKEVLPALLAARNHPDKDLRSDAAAALGQMGPAVGAVLPYVAELLKENNQQAQQKALAMLGKHGLTAAPAYAQRADENAVKAADDAFGVSVGNEEIGLYGDSDARGFSPVAAGNIRMEGLYVDSPNDVPHDVMQQLSGPSGVVQPVYYKLLDWK